MKFIVNKQEFELILLGVTGSRLYGNSTPVSDWDYRGVFISSNESKLGLLGHVEHLKGEDLFDILNSLPGIELEETDDIELFEVKKFINLAVDNNPNIMDILSFDEESVIYSSPKGDFLMKESENFLSKKIKFTFSGYAVSQLKRIQGHNKWLMKYPDINVVTDFINGEFKLGKIDWQWISDNFSGELANYITGETAQEHSRLDKSKLISYEDFKLVLFKYQPKIELDIYRRPQLIDYCFCKDLKDKSLDKDIETYEIKEFTNEGTFIYNKHTLTEFLTDKGSFRKISENTLVLFTDGDGIFNPKGELKKIPPEEVGDFICLVSVDHFNFKGRTDDVRKVWHWKVNRNDKRSSLEAKFGYDTKHGSHLVRLMLGAKRVLNNKSYHPRLVGEELQLVKDVRAGKYSYDWLIDYSEKMDKELDELYQSSTLQHKVDIKKINKLLLELCK